MKVAFFDTHAFEISLYREENKSHGHKLEFFQERLTPETAILALGYPAVCAFVNDTLQHETLSLLKSGGTNLIALRCSGYNHIDLKSTQELGINVVYVPHYTPHAVAEHAVALMMGLNRKTHLAYNRVRDFNFQLDGLVGFNFFQKKVGIIGTGQIGKVLAQIMKGFGCHVFCYDSSPDLTWAEENNFTYLDLDQLLVQSDILSLHVPLTKQTHHLINKGRILLMKEGVMIINTGRGALIDTEALIEGLKSKHVGAAGLDVYELEKDIFFQDFSNKGINDDILARLISLPNVLLTGHQGFLTNEALLEITQTTLTNISQFEKSSQT
ncbi:MAG: 2-hydroxyacid dehydrogenase [Bacteriovoracaceae bacterium]